jgi:hypothetical protein
LKDHPWLDKGADFFRWTTKFGKDINNVLVENIPLVGRIENATSTVVVGALGYGYYGYDKVIATPIKWGWNATKSIFDFGINKPFNSIRNWFNPSEETLAEMKRLREENEDLKNRPLNRKNSASSIGSYIRAWRTGTKGQSNQAPKTNSTKPRVNTGDENPLPSGSSPWGNTSAPVTPSTPLGERRGDNIKGTAEPALSTVMEESETTPRSKANELINEEGEEEGHSFPGFDV